MNHGSRKNHLHSFISLSSYVTTHTHDRQKCRSFFHNEETKCMCTSIDIESEQFWQLEMEQTNTNERKEERPIQMHVSRNSPIPHSCTEGIISYSFAAAAAAAAAD